MTLYQNLTPSIDAHLLLEEQCCQIPSRFGLKPQSFWFFKRSPQQEREEEEQQQQQQGE